MPTGTPPGLRRARIASARSRSAPESWSSRSGQVAQDQGGVLPDRPRDRRRTRFARARAGRRSGRARARTRPPSSSPRLERVDEGIVGDGHGRRRAADSPPGPQQSRPLRAGFDETARQAEHLASDEPGCRIAPPYSTETSRHRRDPALDSIVVSIDVPFHAGQPHDRGARPRFRPARRGDGERPLGRQRRARQLRAAQGGDGRGRRGPDPVPPARAARDALRAQRLPLPRPRARSSSRASGSGTASAPSTSSACAMRRRPTTSTSPTAEDVRTQVGKPGAYSFEPVDPELAETHAGGAAGRLRRRRTQTYERLVEQGVARELARAVLPVGAYTEFYWTVNARSLMNFVSLRASETAQREIRRYADACERLLRRARCRSRTRPSSTPAASRPSPP